jgi:ABC-type sugar transport system permease subunit
MCLVFDLAMAEARSRQAVHLFAVMCFLLWLNEWRCVAMTQVERQGVRNPPTPARIHAETVFSALMRSIWRERESYLLLLPILVLYGVFSLWPIVQTFYLSFYDAKIVRLGPFVGLKNYIAMNNSAFRQAFGNTVVFAILSIVIILVIAIPLAVLVNSPGLRFKTVFKVAYFLPVVTSFVAAGYIWKWMYEPTYGVVNRFLALFGIHGPKWLSNPNLALLSVIIVNVWKWVGYFIVILLANLQLIEPVLYEAAAIDGAGPLQQFFLITLPLLRSAIGLCVVLGVINFLSGFSLVFVMTSGGPGGRTALIATYVYNEAFGTGQLRIGYSAAASVVLFALLIAFTFMSNRAITREV